MMEIFNIFSSFKLHRLMRLGVSVLCFGIVFGVCGLVCFSSLVCFAICLKESMSGCGKGWKNQPDQRKVMHLQEKHVQD